MKKHLVCELLTLTLIPLGLASTALASGFKVETSASRTQTYRGNQSLKRFQVITQNKTTTLDMGGLVSKLHAVDARFVYETDTVANLEKYVIVQWTRGCKFESESDGVTVKKHFNLLVPHFGRGNIPFRFPDWVIDTDNPSPVYSSYVNDNGDGPAGKYRYALLRWNKNPASLDPETATFYLNSKPAKPVVFLTDLPGGFGVESEPGDRIQRAKNSSVEFKTCIFESQDIPDETDPQGRNIPQDHAIACFRWDSKFIYDFKTGRYDSPSEIDPVCLSDEVPREARLE